MGRKTAEAAAKKTAKANATAKATATAAAKKTPKATAKKTPKATAKKTSRTPSEDELRTKVVYQFLLGLGFHPNDVDIEYAFTIQIGRGKDTRPRADALVSKGGRAFFVIECKREDHDLATADHKQAISYARLVQPHIPPYTILTNGKQTIILDTYLGQVADEVVVRDGMVASPLSFEEAMRRRYEANKYLLSLSSHTLKAFIIAELEEQIRIHSTGSFRPPYSPSTHIPRSIICDTIVDFCKNDRARILPVVGPATVGKTSEIFSCIQHRLVDAESGVLPLYVPLNYAGTDFLPYLADNFGWALGQPMSEVRLIHDIDEIARVQRRNCVVYILDGADLAPAALSDLRREIANHLRRTGVLSCKHKVIIVSQEPTWLRLVAGQSVDLSSYCQTAVSVDRLSPEQSLLHIQALEAHYAIRMPKSNGLPGLPAISHMLAQRTKAGSVGAEIGQDILGQYFNWQLTKAPDDSALLKALIEFSTRQLEELAQHDLGKNLDLNDAVTAGFIVRSKDGHGRESYAFSDDWIHYFIVGFHIWRVDRSPTERLLPLVEQARERVEYARVLEWLSFVMGEHSFWRAVSQRRPSFYLQCYKCAAELLKALAVDDDACLWLAPSRGSLNSPWCSIISGEPGEIRWGKDPDHFPDEAPSEYIKRPDFSIFSRKPLAHHMADDAINALKEIQRWLPNRRDYSERNRLWLAQHRVFLRLRNSLSGRTYDLADVACTIANPEYQPGLQMLREIFEEALRLTHSVAESEFFGIRDFMPIRVRCEVGVYNGNREITSEYSLRSETPGFELVLAEHDEIDRWWERDDEFLLTHVRGHSVGNNLLHMLGITSSPLINWAELNRVGALRRINAAGNLAAGWLADGISSAVSRSPSREMSEARSRILAHLEAAGIVDHVEEEIQVTESVLRSFRDSPD